VTFSVSPRTFIAICCSALFATTLSAQTSSQIFSAVDTRSSQNGVSFSAPLAFNSTTVNLNCGNIAPASSETTAPPPGTAILSGPAMQAGGAAPVTPLTAGGNLLVDNTIVVSVTPSGAGSPGAATNVCTGYNNGVGGLYNLSCFNYASYGNNASNGLLTGQDPDTYIDPNGTGVTVDQDGGIAPVDISSLLTAGVQQAVTIQLYDEGGYVTNSTLFLTTTCTNLGVTGPALVSGNTIPGTPTPNSPGVNQGFQFNTNTNAAVGLIYNLAPAVTANTLLPITNAPVPQATDAPIDPGPWTTMAGGTSFAPSQCLIHGGELDANLIAACKLYTLECTAGTTPGAAGANCPISSAPNEVIADVFDPPATVTFTLPSISTPNYGTFQTGFGFLMASEGWTGGPCSFDPASNLDLPCPQNILTSFTGPGANTGSGSTTHPNSTFISVEQVPEIRTTLSVAGLLPDNWINTDTVNVTFNNVAPYLYGSSSPYASTYVASPIKSLSYGVTPVTNPSSVPNPASEPIVADTVVPDGVCAYPALGTTPPAGNPATTVPNFTVKQALKFTADGQYVLHYYAQDCNGTQNLVFKNAGGSVGWTTNFLTQAINIDTAPPTVTSPVLSPAAAGNTYAKGTKVSVSFSCADKNTGSGVVLCGIQLFPLGTFSTGTLTVPLPTSVKGTFTFPVIAIDGAANTKITSFTYKVD
jgi:hypothetical protein